MKRSVFVQVESTAFLYIEDNPENPAEQTTHALLFLALWLAMLENGKLALCTYMARHSASPRLVLLRAIEEETDHEQQVWNPAILEFRASQNVQTSKFTLKTYQVPKHANSMVHVF